MRNKSKIKTFFLEVLIVVILLTLIFNLLIPFLERLKSRTLLYICGGNIKELGVALQKYSNDHEGQYPTPSKWCDLLIENTEVSKHKFLCKSANDSIFGSHFPIDANHSSAKVRFIIDNNGHLPLNRREYIYSVDWSHYAINPEAKPGSSPDIVLLFETEHGWNQAGGPELISIYNHLTMDVEGCHVVFNDGSRKFIKPKHIDKLKWK